MGLTCSAISKRDKSAFEESSSHDDSIEDETKAETVPLTRGDSSSIIKPRSDIHYLMPFETQILKVAEYYTRKFSESYKYLQSLNFVRKSMNQIVCRYADWMVYPEGDQTLTGHKTNIFAAAVSGDGRYLYTGSKDKRIMCWDLTLNQSVDCWVAHADSVLCLAYHDSGLLVSGSADSSIKIWQYTSTLDTKPYVRTLKGHIRAVMTVSVDSAGQTLVSGSADRSMRLWSAQSGQCIGVFNSHKGSVSSTIFINDCIISGSFDKSLKSWNSQCELVLKGKDIDNLPGPVYALSINCDQTLIACVTSANVMILEYPMMKVVRTIALKGIQCACFHPKYPGMLAVGCDNDNSVRVLSVDRDRQFAGDCICTIDGHKSVVRDVCFTIPEGNQVISVSDDHSARIWDLTLVINCVSPKFVPPTAFFGSD